MEDDDSIENTPAWKLADEITSSMDQEFHDSPDRVLAIVGAAYLDTAIERLLRGALVDDAEEVNQLLGREGSLSGAAARQRIAWCLGLIESVERDDLRIVARIRNLFAHQYAVMSFDHADVKKLLNRLSIRQVPSNLPGRTYFKMAVRGLFVTLVQRVKNVKRAGRETWFPRTS
jgi:DNA-binding MltR family transcriptional regulator